MSIGPGGGLSIGPDGGQSIGPDGGRSIAPDGGMSMTRNRTRGLNTETMHPYPAAQGGAMEVPGVEMPCVGLSCPD